MCVHFRKDVSGEERKGERRRRGDERERETEREGEREGERESEREIERGGGREREGGREGGRERTKRTGNVPVPAGSLILKSVVGKTVESPQSTAALRFSVSKR